jgi:predicted transcriptional regulator
MWPFSRRNRRREDIILSFFMTNMHEMTAMDLHRRTDIPLDAIERILRRLERDGMLISRLSEQAAEQEWRRQRLYKIK